MNDVPDFLSVKEFAARYKLCDDTITKQCRRGELPCVYVGRRVLIPADALMRMLDGRGWQRKP